jgi:hypothetical protein
MPKYTVTPGIALLSLIYKIKNNISRYLTYRKKSNRYHYESVIYKEMLFLNTLKRIYFLGASNSEYTIILTNILLTRPEFKNVDFSLCETDINNEAERRYFETWLAYATIKNTINTIDLDALESLFKESVALLDLNALEENSILDAQTINDVLNGNAYRKFDCSINTQFCYYIDGLFRGSVFTNANFSTDDREKLLSILRIVYIGIINGRLKTPLPLDIYESNPILTIKGKLRLSPDEKKYRRTVRNQCYGLLKGHMPPLGYNDVVFADRPFKHPKSSDYATPDLEATTPQNCFAQLTQIFSNGASGILLVQLRVFAKLIGNNSTNIYLQSDENFSVLLKLIISTLMFYSGGHSFYEYGVILDLPEVKDTFKTFAGSSEIDIKTLFYQDNRIAFNEALNKTLEYSVELQKRAEIHKEILQITSNSQSMFFKSTDTSKENDNSLHKHIVHLN